MGQIMSPALRDSKVNKAYAIPAWNANRETNRHLSPCVINALTGKAQMPRQHGRRKSQVLGGQKKSLKNIVFFSPPICMAFLAYGYLHLVVMCQPGIHNANPMRPDGSCERSMIISSTSLAQEPSFFLKRMLKILLLFG